MIGGGRFREHGVVRWRPAIPAREEMELLIAVIIHNAESEVGNRDGREETFS